MVDELTLFAESLLTALNIRGYHVSRIDPTPAERAGEVVASLDPPPRIVVLDLDVGGEDSALSTIEALTRTGAQVAAVTASDDRSQWARCIEIGAVTVLPKTAPLQRLLETVDLLRDGRPVMSAPERAELLAAWHRQSRREHELTAGFSRLTEDERWVLGQLAKGRIVHDIARSRGVAPGLVLQRVDSIIHKLQVSSWLDAVEMAQDRGWPVTG